MSACIDTNLSLGAWKMAIAARGLPKGLIHHSDRGVQYTATAYQNRLRGCIARMSRKGNCWGNAVSESFFATLEKELLLNQCFDSFEQAKVAIFEYIEIYYNRQRLHSAIDYPCPQHFEQAFERQTVAS